MKNILPTIFLAVIFLTIASDFVFSNENNQLITELFVIDNDTTFRYDYLYDSFGNKVLETKFYQNNNSWFRQSQTEWKYDTDKCKYQIERVWKGNAWNVAYTIDYSRVDGLLITETHKKYINNSAQLIKRIDYRYNSTVLKSKKIFEQKSNEFILTLQSDYSFSPSTFSDTVKTTVYQSINTIKQYLLVNNYNTNGLIDTQILQEKEPNKDWLNTEKIIWYYKPNTSLVLSERIKTWDKLNSIWEYSQKTDYEYNTNYQITSETYQNWKTMFWEDVTRYNYEYNPETYLVKKTLLTPIYHNWRNMISVNYSDFSNKKAGLMESKYEFWGGNTGELTTSFIPFMFNNEMAIRKGKQLKLSYVPNSDTGIPTIEYLKSIMNIPVYPNPSNGIFYFNPQQYGVQSWLVSDLNGQVIKNQVQSENSGVIDIIDLPKGIYVLQVFTKDAQLTQKLIKE